MRIFVHEHVTGGRGCGERLPEGLAREGLAMLQAIVEDLALTGKADVVTTIDERFSLPSPPGNVTARRISSAAMLEEEFDALAASSDGTLLIAPELDGLSARLARRVIHVGGKLLGSQPTAMETASDKLLLPRRLEGRGVSCVPAEPFGAGDDPPSWTFPFPVVVKPRRGAGSTETYLARRRDDLPAARRESVVTPLLPGIPASVLVLVGSRDRMPLCPSEQILSRDGRFRYLGGRMPLEGDLACRAADLALRAVQCVPGLGGFVGVDMLLHTDGAGSPADHVVEINSRLTTSYVGLRTLAASNLASAWLGVIDGRPVPAPTWHDRRIRFHPDGSVERLEAC